MAGFGHSGHPVARSQPVLPRLRPELASRSQQIHTAQEVPMTRWLMATALIACAAPALAQTGSAPAAPVPSPCEAAFRHAGPPSSVIVIGSIAARPAEARRPVRPGSTAVAAPTPSVPGGFVIGQGVGSIAGISSTSRSGIGAMTSSGIGAMSSTGVGSMSRSGVGSIGSSGFGVGAPPSSAFTPVGSAPLTPVGAGVVASPGFTPMICP